MTMRPLWRFERYLDEEYPYSIVLCMIYTLVFAWWLKPLEAVVFWVIERPISQYPPTSESKDRPFKVDEDPEL